MSAASGTKGYAAEADALFVQYESISFAEVHRAVLHLIPAAPCDALDIGAGTGRDAAALAAMGHRLLAVEPAAEMRTRAVRLHPSPLIEWLDDSLPALAQVTARRQHFDLVILSAVWMHLDKRQRRQAMPIVAGLLRIGAVMTMTLRHGPVPPGRRMFAVSGEETIGLAEASGLQLILNRNGEGALRRPGVSWTRLAFAKPACA
jgi:SAM-dependent methyltransferase